MIYDIYEARLCVKWGEGVTQRDGVLQVIF